MTELSEFVSLEQNKLTTDSLRVARHFGKRHDNVLRAIDKMEIDQDLRLLNFEDTFFSMNMPNGAMRQDRAVRMTKDGFVLLVMGFSGRQAMNIKVAYIKAFNILQEQNSAIESSAVKDFWFQCLTVEKMDAATFESASQGSKQMLRRKKILPLIDEERARLKDAMEPELFDSLVTSPRLNGNEQQKNLKDSHD